MSLDEQDYDELLKLVVKAQAEEMIDGILIQNSPSNRLISLKRLEVKLIQAKADLKVDPDVVTMLDGRQPPGMGDTQVDERY